MKAVIDLSSYLNASYTVDRDQIHMAQRIIANYIDARQHPYEAPAMRSTLLRVRI